MSQFSSVAQTPKRAFAIFDLLAIVAIVTLLASILMPAMITAKEKAKATACLAGLNKQGSGFAAYSKDNRQYLPYGGKYRYVILDAGRRNLHWLDTTERWNRQGNGLLYPKYIGNTVDPFYCPSNTWNGVFDANRGKSRFLYLYNNPASGGYSNDLTTPIGGYAYALPLAQGKSPRDGTKQCYTDESMEEVQPDFNDGGTSKYKSYSPRIYSPFRTYLWDATVQSNPSINNYLAPIVAPRTTARPNGPRGNHPVQALLVDCFFGGYSAYHINEWNVLYSDFHANPVADPTRKIDNAQGSVFTYQSAGTGPQTYMVWDYLSSQAH